MASSHNFKFNEFADVPVITTGSCNLFMGVDSIFSRNFCFFSTGIFMPFQKYWPIGSEVRFEFRIHDEILTYEGFGKVARYSHCQEGFYEGGMVIEFTQIDRKSLSFTDRLRQLSRAQDTAIDVTYGAAKYVLAEARGNRVERDLGKPYHGFKEHVLLIQGWLGTRGVFALLENKLQRDGFRVFSFHLGALNIQDIAKSAQMVADKIHRVSHAMNIRELTIIGHSMGGLIGLYALKKLDIANHVNKLIAIGTPFDGTPAAYAGLPFLGAVAKSLWQMLPDSDFIHDLHADPLPANVEIVSIMSRLDMLAPEKYCVLKGARNILVSAGHAALVVDDRIYRVVRALIQNQPLPL